MTLSANAPPMSNRQTSIVSLARTRDRVEVEDLARHFDVTTQTIRRDVNDLCARGILSRLHGGARIANSVSNVGYEERRILGSEEKRLIGERTAELIPSGCSLIMNIGTTVEQVAQSIINHRDLMIITNNMNIVNTLSGTPEKELIVSGGVVRQSDGAIVGEAAVEFMRGFRADYAVIGSSALDEDGGIMDFDVREVSVSRAIINAARKTILVSDNQKFERRAPVRIASVAEIDVFVTDKLPPPAFREACKASGTEIIVADPSLTASNVA